MEARIDRRAPDVHRIPLDVLVQLTHEDYEEPFDADGVDVSAGGLALRADYLPEVGDRLRCRFDCPPDGAEVELDGEVVWAHDAGERSGEFGLRFAELDAPAEAALRRMFAESDAEDGGPGPRARLHLDAVATPIDADVVERTESSLSVEQELPFLRIGMGVVVEGTGPAHGRLASVELRMRDGVPRLLLRVEDTAAKSTAAVEAALVEASVASAPVEPALDDDDATLQDHPTLPDVNAEETPVVQVQAAALDALVGRRALPEVGVREEAPVRDDQAGAASIAPARFGSSWARIRETASTLVWQARPKLTAFWAKLTALVGALLENVSPHAKRSWHRVSASAATLKTRVSRARVKRRTTSTPPTRVAQAPRRRQQRREPDAVPKKTGRLVLVAALAFAGAGAVVYWLIASGEPAQLPTEPTAQLEVEPAPLAATPEAPASPEPIETEERVEAEPEVQGGQLDEPTYPSLRDAARHAPEVSPVREGTSFGANEVPNGQTTTLRMSQPVTTLRGESQSDGFTVTIPGSLALDGARGLAASNPNVDQSMILNRGDHAVLTIRFVDGRTPAYRVEARGAAIAITIAN